MTLPNRLTMVRVFSVPVLLVCLAFEPFFCRVLALLIFIGASLTDYYDGKIARRRGEITDFGKFMDPLADKMLVSAAFVSFVELQELSVPAWMVVAIISREFIITGLRTLGAAKGMVISADFPGKFKTATQMTAIITILVFLAVNAGLRQWWLDPQYLLYMSGWSGYLGEVLHKGPYLLMFVTTILTLTSGVGYILQYKQLLRTQV